MPRLRYASVQIYMYSPFKYSHSLGVSNQPNQTATYRYISSKGRVSLKQLSHTEFTTRSACSLSLICGLFNTDKVALFLTQSWKCFTILNFPSPKNCRVKRHSPLRVDARICEQSASFFRKIFMTNSLQYTPHASCSDHQTST
jgi:hypothetical protein